jgi:hypothetical protein
MLQVAAQCLLVQESIGFGHLTGWRPGRSSRQKLEFSPAPELRLLDTMARVSRCELNQPDAVSELVDELTGDFGNEPSFRSHRRQ